jgi:ABC-type transport system involved in multi-copper enzyme maturation permease subunit
MNCLPVIEMEMRSAARRKWTFVLRLLFALTGGAACLLVLLLPPLAPVPKGQTMLVLLSYLSLSYCLLAGGFLTADSVSSEKREGTLGLLFLTPLSGMDIVLGKMVCHGLQMFYGLCAVFPVFFLPVLAGSVTWAEVSRISLALVLALVLGASIGVVISVLVTESWKAMMATLSVVLLLAAVPMLYLMARRTFLGSAGGLNGFPQFSPLLTVHSGFDSSYNSRAGPGLFWGSVLACGGLSLALVLASGWLLETVFSIQGHPAAKSRERFAGQRGPLPVCERNPYEWALLRSAGGARSIGVLIWGLLLLFAVMLPVSVLSNHGEEGFTTAFFTALAIHLVAKLRFAIEATRQVNDDHLSGAMELLLVTTLPQESILQGHERALRRLSLKPLALLIFINFALELCVLLFPENLHMDSDATVMFTLLFLGGMVLALADFSALRWLALWHALRAGSHVKAALGAFKSAMLLPWLGMALIMAITTSNQVRISGFVALFSVWIVGCLLYDSILIRWTGNRLNIGLRRVASERVTDAQRPVGSLPSSFSP